MTELRRRPTTARTRAAALLALVALWLQACTISLAPPYDQSLVDGLNRANEQALVFFSSVSAGAPRGRFPALAPQYDALIGKFAALQAQAGARDAPALGRSLARALPMREDMAAICGEDAAACVNVTPHVLGEIVETFAHMRQENAARSLTAFEVRALRDTYVQSIDQALTVETALKR